VTSSLTSATASDSPTATSSPESSDRIPPRPGSDKMATPPPHHVDPGADVAPDRYREPVYDPLEMLVTSDPVAELDDTLLHLSRRVRHARHSEDGETATRLQRWIDAHLDERSAFRTGPNPRRTDAM
jgi:hypothetical protein